MTIEFEFAKGGVFLASPTEDFDSRIRSVYLFSDFRVEK